MKKIYGYLLVIIGLLGLFLNSTAGRKLAPFIETLPIGKQYILIGSLILIVLGVVVLIVFGGGKGKQIEKEVPIYKGKKIIGYRVQD